MAGSHGSSLPAPGTLTADATAPCQVVGEPCCGCIPIDDLVEGQLAGQGTRPPDVAAELLTEHLDQALQEQARPGSSPLPCQQTAGTAVLTAVLAGLFRGCLLRDGGRL
jgi:hypothetical protein